MAQKEITPEQKAKAVIELLIGEKMPSEIAASVGVTAKTVNNWHREFMDNAHRAFTVTKDVRLAERVAKETKEREEALMQKVGQLVIELDWAKKKSKQAGL